MNSYESLISQAKIIVRAAGQLILELEQRDFAIAVKSKDNYVTEIDLAVERYVVGCLRDLTPDFELFTEEGDSATADFSRPTWILDPVDGTTNLMRGYRHSAVSLALSIDEKPVIGLIYNPYADELYIAVTGCGATLNGSPIHVSSRSNLADGLIGFGTTPYDRQLAHQTFEQVERIFLKSLEVRRSGSAALDIAYVACGRLDGFFEQTLQPWDYAAGSIILSEAGGRLTNWQNCPPNLRHGDSLLASNTLLHDILRRELLKEVIHNIRL
ncbi:MAG TPA: inositol monophosphatase [Clostridiales bacterium]|nr:inositol monophosphatase [Clostridiales bacterium]